MQLVIIALFVELSLRALCWVKNFTCTISLNVLLPALAADVIILFYI